MKKENQKRTCSVENCNNPDSAKSFCQKHLWHFNKYGDPEFYENKRLGLCIVDFCNKKAKAKNLCSNHYSLYRRNGNPLVKRQKRHGLSKTVEYGIWSGIKRRCYNKNEDNYKYYGGKGIVVCDRWKDSIELFYEDMGKRPGDNFEIDRIDSSGNYEPNNCQWLEKIKNVRKSTASKIKIEDAREIRSLYKTGKYTLKFLGDNFNIHYSTVSAIINNRLWKEQGFTIIDEIKKGD